MQAFAHDVYTYPLPAGHRFPLGKYRLVREGAEAAGIAVEDARGATDEELGLAHDAGYLARVGRGHLARREVLALGLPWSLELVERARRSVGATLTAAETALADGVAANVGGGTHHAFTDSGRGFCVFNDVVVATRALRQAGRAARAGRRPRRAPGRRHARGLPGRSGDVHVLRQRLPQLPVPARAGRSRARPPRRHGGRPLPRRRRPAPAAGARTLAAGDLLLPRGSRPVRRRPARAARPHEGRAGAARRARPGRFRARGGARVPDARRRLRRPDRGHRGDQRGDPAHIRVAVVTGGSSGIGAATARLLAERGWHCVLLARDPARLERVAAEIGAEIETCDVGDRAQLAAVAGRVAERHAAVHLLVSNAGIPGGGGFLDLAPERIEEIVRTNYLGSVWALRAFLPLLEAGAPSDVVNVASVAGVYATGGASGPYAASKHAQLAFSRAVGVELAPKAIRVHAVNPGPVRTEGFPQDGLRGTRLDRLVLEPERVAEAILRAVERNRPESYVFAAYRLAGLAQAALPGTLARLAARRRRRATPT